MTANNARYEIWLRSALLMLVALAPRCCAQGEVTSPVARGMSGMSGMEVVNSVHSEVDVGEFVVPIRLNDSNSTITIFTRLYVTVRINEEEKFREVLEARQARFREKVIIAFRGVSRDQLYERNLKAVKEGLYLAMVEAIDSPNIYRVGFISFYYSEE